MKHATGKATDHTAGRGNVFTDLRVEEPEAEPLKAGLPHGLATLVGRHGRSQAQTAEALGIDQAKVSAIVRGRLGGFSTGRRMRLPTRPDHDVRITGAPNPSNERPARTTVLPRPGSPDHRAEPVGERRKA